jgi:hypothetical protein
MDRFLRRSPRGEPHVSEAGFWMGFLTAVIQLPALLGALNGGCVADKVPWKFSFIVAVVIFVASSVFRGYSWGNISS